MLRLLFIAARFQWAALACAALSGCTALTVLSTTPSRAPPPAADPTAERGRFSIGPDQLASLGRIGVLPVFYVPYESEAMLERSLAVEGKVGLAAGSGLGISAGASMCTLPPLCYLALPMIAVGAMGAMGGLVAGEFIARDRLQRVTRASRVIEPRALSDALPAWWTAARLEELGRNRSVQAIRAAGVLPHETAGLDYVASVAPIADAIVELNALGLYFYNDEQELPRLVMPLRVRVVRVADRKILSDAVIVGFSAQSRTLGDWNRNEGADFTQALMELCVQLADRVGGEFEWAPKPAQPSVADRLRAAFAASRKPADAQPTTKSLPSSNVGERIRTW